MNEETVKDLDWSKTCVVIVIADYNASSKKVLKMAELGFKVRELLESLEW